MKFFLTIAIFFCFLSRSQFQRADASLTNPHATATQWDSTSHWKLYKLSTFKRVFDIPADSLRFLEAKPLNDDSMHRFLYTVKKLAGINPMWQGCYLASYQAANGQTQKVVISHYAGFFYYPLGKVYYQVDPSVLRDWLEYLSDSYVAIGTQN